MFKAVSFMFAGITLLYSASPFVIAEQYNLPVPIGVHIDNHNNLRCHGIVFSHTAKSTQSCAQSIFIDGRERGVVIEVNEEASYGVYVDFLEHLKSLGVDNIRTVQGNGALVTQLTE